MVMSQAQYKVQQIEGDNMRRKGLDLFSVVNTAVMLALIFVTLYPFLYLINVSLSSQLYVMRNEVFFWPKGFTLEWYKLVFDDKRIGLGFRNSLMYTVLEVILSLSVTSMGAFALSQSKMICRRQFSLAITFTILFGGGMIPSYLVAKQIGIIDTIWGMVLPGFVSTYNLLVFRTFFEGLPKELLEAGEIDGMTDLGVFFRIIVPLSIPVYAAIGLFVAVGMWNNFYNSMIYLMRNSDLFPLQMILRDLIIRGQLAADAMARTASSERDTVVVSLKYATIIVSTVPIIIVYPFLQKYFVKGMLLGSLKA